MTFAFTRNQWFNSCSVMRPVVRLLWPLVVVIMIVKSVNKWACWRVAQKQQSTQQSPRSCSCVCFLGAPSRMSTLFTVQSSSTSCTVSRRPTSRHLSAMIGSVALSPTDYCWSTLFYVLLALMTVLSLGTNLIYGFSPVWAPEL